GPALLQPPDRGQPVVHLERDQLLARRPTEDPPGQLHPTVDLQPGEPRFDHLLTHGFERERTELPGRGRAVQLADGPDRQPVLPDLAGVVAVGVAEVLLRVLPEPEQDLVNARPRARDAQHMRGTSGRWPRASHLATTRLYSCSASGLP